MYIRIELSRARNTNVHFLKFAFSTWTFQKLQNLLVELVNNSVQRAQSVLF